MEELGPSESQILHLASYAGKDSVPQKSLCQAHSRLTSL
jgi:hypothetical protein